MLVKPDNLCFFLERESGEITFVTCSAHSNIDDVIEAFRGYLLAVGYQPDNINEALGEPG